MDESKLVLAIYKEAARDGNPPIPAIAESFGVSIRTASSMARRAAASARKYPMRNKKIIAVADRLDVPYDALVAAVIEEAGGDIRVSKR